MSNHFSISLGQCSETGRKEINQDFHGALSPSGPKVARLQSATQLKRLVYKPSQAHDWVDAALQKAVHPNAHKRYETLPQFTTDLTTPNPLFSNRRVRPLAEKPQWHFGKL